MRRFSTGTLHSKEEHMAASIIPRSHYSRRRSSCSEHSRPFDSELLSNLSLRSSPEIGQFKVATQPHKSLREEVETPQRNGPEALPVPGTDSTPRSSSPTTVRNRMDAMEDFQASKDEPEEQTTTKDRKIIVVASPITPRTSKRDTSNGEEDEEPECTQDKGIYEKLFKNEGTIEPGNNSSNLLVNYDERALPSGFYGSEYRVTGLPNLGNSCFFNSTVQNLLNTELLANFFQNYSRVKSSRKFQGKLTSAFRQMFSQSRSCGTMSPRGLFSEVCRFAPRFRGHAQQDAHELLRFLLDGIHEEALKENKSEHHIRESSTHRMEEPESMEPTSIATDSSDDSSNSADPHSYNEEPSNECNSDETSQPIMESASNIQEQQGKSFIERIFSGRLCNIITCHGCLESSITMDPCFDVSVPLSRAKQTSNNNNKNSKPHGYVPEDIKQSIRQMTVTPKQDVSSRKGNNASQKKKSASELARLKASQQKLSTGKKPPKQKRPVSAWVASSKEDKKVPEWKGYTKVQLVEWLLENGSPEWLEDKGLLEPQAKKAAKSFRKSTLQQMAEEISSHSQTEKVDGRDENGKEESSHQLFVTDIDTTEGEHKPQDGQDRDPDSECAELPQNQSYRAQTAILVENELSVPLPCAVVGELGPSSWPPMEELQKTSVNCDGVAVDTSAPKTYNPGTLEACLSLFSEPEVLSVSKGNGYRCEKCGKLRKQEIRRELQQVCGSDVERLHQEYDDIDVKGGILSDATKRMLLCSPPPVLTIHLKRFRPTRNGFTKDNTPIEFPLVLDLSPFCVRKDSAVCKQGSSVVLRNEDHLQPVEYELQGIVVHKGGMGGGHYVAFLRTESGWFLASDTTVKRVTQQEALKAQPYLLFYQRVQSS